MGVLLVGVGGAVERCEAVSEYGYAFCIMIGVGKFIKGAVYMLPIREKRERPIITSYRKHQNKSTPKYN